MKVLIVDDSPDALVLAMHRLAPEGAVAIDVAVWRDASQEPPPEGGPDGALQVVCVDGGKAGLEAAAIEQPDLILLDVDMPDVSGFDVCRALKADPDLCTIPIIFLSGSGGPEDKIKGLDLGAVDYVTKPFDAFELRARVRAALRTKRLQDLLVKRARIDPLTGLANRGAFAERMGQEWARIQRHGGTVSLIMGDVDHFKEVNDTHGHMVGDRVLCEVAAAIAGRCREIDLPSRYGGEEFAIIVPGEKTFGAVHLAERCRQAVQAVRVQAGTVTVGATASFGVADSEGADSPEALIQRADEALYRAKNAGRNRVASDDSERSSK